MLEEADMFLRSCANVGTGLTCQKMKRMGIRLSSKSCNGDLIVSFHPQNTISIILLELNDLIVKLDAAADVVAKSVPTFTPKRKQRVVSATPSTSTLSPPADAPDWEVRPEYRKKYGCHDCFIFTCRSSIE